jgi:hypothetical protein
MEANSAPLDTQVLLNILKVLQKLDCTMERLEILETISPTSHTGSTLVNSSPISRKQSTRTAASKRTLVHSGNAEDMNEYARSIMKMDYAIDEAVSFIQGDEAAPEDNSVADVSIDGSERINMVTGTWADLVPEPQDVDLYSVSMYTGDLMGSRMSLDVLRQTQAIFTPPIRNAPSRPHSELSQDDLEDSQSMDVEESLGVPFKERDASIITRNPGTVSDVESVAINTNKINTNPTYLRIELGFHAFDTWKQGVVSKIKNESKTLWQDEKRRFNDLRHTYRAKDMVQRVVDKLGSALESEWREEKERVKSLQPEKKKGVKLMEWRIVISFRSMFNVRREQAWRDVIC